MDFSNKYTLASLKMNIVFLCGSLEFGKDGVGDYIRRLSGELMSRGYKIGIIALNDKYVSQDIDRVETIDCFAISVLRIPAKWTFRKRFLRAGLWVGGFNPQWISLQFVPFAFHPHGLSFRLNKALKKLGKGREWHVMIHELWVGMDKEASLKFMFWGWGQRQLIKSLFIKLKPKIIHTQSALYCKVLAKIGIGTTILPLFGNIPLASNRQIQKGYDSKKISFIVFGGIHSGAPVKEFANELKLYAISTGTEILMKIIGRCGQEQLQWEREFKQAGLPIQILGEQSPQSISKVLSNSSFGISTTPAFLTDKSGSVAAMLEHGLRILCVSRAWHPRGISNINLPDGVVQYRPGEFGQLIKGNSKSYRSYNVSDVANQFVSNLLVTV